MNPEETFDKIEAYLKGQLDAKEKAAFEQKMATDSNLQEEVALHRLEQQSMELLVEKDIRGKMQKWKTESKEVTQAPKRNTIVRLGPWLAAATVALLLLFYFLVPKEQVLSGPELAAQYYEKPKSSQERSINIDNQNPLLEAFTLFDASNFIAAADLFGAVPAASPYYWLAQEWLGHSQYNANQLAQAIETFKRVVDGDVSPYSERNEWNLLLAYLKDNQEREARQVLNKVLEEEGHAYHKKVEKLKQHLKVG